MRQARCRVQSSAHRSLHQFADPRLVGGGQPGQSERDRPHGAFVEAPRRSLAVWLIVLRERSCHGCRNGAEWEHATHPGLTMSPGQPTYPTAAHAPADSSPKPPPCEPKTWRRQGTRRGRTCSVWQRPTARTEQRARPGATPRCFPPRSAPLSPRRLVSAIGHQDAGRAAARRRRGGGTNWDKGPMDSVGLY
jgi:hypothetical protein